jgi:hypothetical protein
VAVRIYVLGGRKWLPESCGYYTSYVTAHLLVAMERM